MDNYINAFNFGSIPIESISIGMHISYSQTITDSDIKCFAGLSGDHNPVHIDEKFAEESRFGKRIAHGLISASFFSQLFGTKLPGPGCLYTAQNLKFLKPVFIDETVTATIEVISVDIERRRVSFRTFCTVNSIIVIDGEAEIYIPKK